jgi:hypothetical protein
MHVQRDQISLNLLYQMNPDTLQVIAYWENVSDLQVLVSRPP